MSFTTIKALLILITFVIMIINLKYVSNTILKVSITVVLCLIQITIFNSKYENYATDNIISENIPILNYTIDDNTNAIVVEYFNDKKEGTVTIDEGNYFNSFDTGMNEVIFSKREYKKEIVVFNKYTISLKSEFKDDITKAYISTYVETDFAE